MVPSPFIPEELGTPAAPGLQGSPTSQYPMTIGPISWWPVARGRVVATSAPRTRLTAAPRRLGRRYLAPDGSL